MIYTAKLCAGADRLSTLSISHLASVAGHRVQRSLYEEDGIARASDHLTSKPHIDSETPEMFNKDQRCALLQNISLFGACFATSISQSVEIVLILCTVRAQISNKMTNSGRLLMKKSRFFSISVDFVENSR